ncbi:hypothetical protein F511_42932 [Dorcoceras hygrometricum]|uniref:Dystroglycan-like n=1 Tax=Dorcoceras hygrometricum TaxID=472368 RepID=A0A2Z7B5N7_9LAMI|nr:hypothetical protein F511_42932 [Dorcoceras hygrometricum]
MASSLISNSHHIDFDAVFGMEDTDLVQIFESLIVTGLKNFLGYPAVFNEDALTEFFANSSVREDGLVVSTVNGVSVEISEEVFAATFELPVEGLTDLSEVPKNLVFNARSLIASITEATTGDVDAAIEQVLAQLDLVIQDSDVEISDSIETWFDRAFDEEFVTADQENQDSKDDIDFDVDNQELPVFDDTRTVPEAGGSKSFGVDKAGEKGIGTTHSTEEHMSIDDLLMQISEDMMLPSVTAAEITKIRLGDSLNIHEVQERDLYYASLPCISIHDKGKEKLEEDEPHAAGRRLAPQCAAAVHRPLRDRTCFDHRDEMIPSVAKSVKSSSADRWRKIDSGRGPDWRIYRRLPRRARFSL